MKDKGTSEASFTLRDARCTLSSAREREREGQVKERAKSARRSVGEVGGWGRDPKNVREEIGGWGRVPFNETYAPSLSTIYDGA